MDSCRVFVKKYVLEFEEFSSSLRVNSTKIGEIVQSICAASAEKRSHHRQTFVTVILKEKKAEEVGSRADWASIYEG